MSTRGDGAVAAAAAHQAQADAAKSRKSWGETLSRRRIVLVLISVMLGMLLSALDQTIVGTALPKIVQTFPNGVEHYVWVTTGYLLAAAASMPIWGKLSDAYGRKPFYAAGMIIFVIGSALSGQAHTMTELIVFRAFQGLGAGAMMPISQAIIGDVFCGHFPPTSPHTSIGSTTQALRSSWRRPCRSCSASAGRASPTRGCRGR